METRTARRNRGSTRSSAPGVSSSDEDPARRPGRHGRLPLPQRPPRPFRGARGPPRQAPEGRQGLHLLRAEAARLAAKSTSATSVPAWSPRTSNSIWGRSVATWDLDLEPLPGHLDRRITVTTPLQKAGAYLLTARMEGGNTSRIVVWLDDTVIVKKPLVDKAYYFVADARTGQPLPRADVELFGWRQVQVGRQERVPRRDQDAGAQDRRRGSAPGSDRRSERPKGSLPMAHHRQHA